MLRVAWTSEPRLTSVNVEFCDDIEFCVFVEFHDDLEFWLEDGVQISCV